MTLCCRSAGHQGHSADQWNAPGAGSVLSGCSNRPQATRRRLAFVPINPGVGMYHDRIKLSSRKAVPTALSRGAQAEFSARCRFRFGASTTRSPRELKANGGEVDGPDTGAELLSVSIAAAVESARSFYGAPGIDLAGPGLKSGKRPREACALLLRRRRLGDSSAGFAGVSSSDGGSRAFRRTVRRRAFHHRPSAVCSRRSRERALERWGCLPALERAVIEWGMGRRDAGYEVKPGVA